MVEIYQHNWTWIIYVAYNYHSCVTCVYTCIKMRLLVRFANQEGISAHKIKLNSETREEDANVLCVKTATKTKGR